MQLCIYGWPMYYCLVIVAVIIKFVCSLYIFLLCFLRTDFLRVTKKLKIGIFSSVDIPENLFKYKGNYSVLPQKGIKKTAQQKVLCKFSSYYSISASGSTRQG
jgi:hypothetical protein